MINDVLMCLQFELGKLGKISDVSDTQTTQFYDVKQDEKNINNFQQLKKSLKIQENVKSQKNINGIS